MSFWDIVWFIVISFAFVAYLMVMFAIITDLFRDPKASGFAKAVWFLALIFLPFITSVVYLIAKGNDMGQRQVQSAQQAREQQEAYIKEVAGSTGPADQIAQAKSMLDAGAITPAEFERLKEKALT
jgi:Short C-terminal domain/Phospholipase_D-nuclease N-terminal